MKKQVYLKDVVTLQLNAQKCNGCGMCLKVCPHGVFKIAGRKALIIDRDYCMECGACALNCPKEAIFVKAGVGCAAAVIQGAFRNTEPSCGCSSAKSGCC
jgi:NAD-dependent dihydropyrimidine dehydrogenase PreA subunit